MTQFYIGLFINIFLQWSCTALIFDRNGIDVIQWKELQKRHLRNEADLTRPFIITGAPSSEWTLLDNNYKGLRNAFGYYDKLSIDTRSTDCSCFRMENNKIDKELCYRFISTFKYLSKQKINDFHVNKSSYYWDQYETLFQWEYPYEACIKRHRVEKSMKYILNHWDQFIMNDLERDLHKRRPKLSARRISFNVITSRHGHLMMDELSHEVVKHIDLMPYFEIFNMTQGAQSIHDMMLWFGSNNYRLIRHTDTSDNLYFVLNGTKTFLLNAPMLINHKQFPFILYPFLHPQSRSEYPLYRMHGDTYDMEFFNQHEVTIHKNEVLYLPSGWWHEAINGDMGSIAINLWFGDRSSSITEALKTIRLPISDAKITDALEGILYFINMITQYFDHDDVDKRYGFMFSYFRKLYPVLDVIYNDNLVFQQNDIDGDNMKWLNMIIDLDNILKCDKNKELYHVLQRISSSCALVTGKEKQKWDVALAQSFDVFDNMDTAYMGLLQEIVAQNLETILYVVAQDAVFTPLFVSLHNI